jgi:sarcosine oxidase
MAQAFDVIVVGGGAMGSAAARQLGKRGVKTLLVEQFELGHERGSSRGPTRAFRHAYPNETYVRLMRDARALWTELEVAAEEQLLRETGAVDIGPHTRDCAEAMQAAGVAHEWLEPRSAAAKFESLAFGADDRILYHREAGVCFAESAIGACARLARRDGVSIRERTRVERLARRGDAVVVTTAAGVFTAEVAVVTAGAWSAPLLAHAGIEVGVVPSLTHVAYYCPRAGLHDAMPVVIEHSSTQPGWYAYVVPSATPRGGIKVGQFWKEQTPLDPDERTFAVDAGVIESHSQYVARRLVGLDPVPIQSENCLYEMTPSEDFVIDRVGPFVVGAGFSGHGFKFAPLVGSHLADLAAGEHPPSLPPAFSLAAHGARVAVSARG